ADDLATPEDARGGRRGVPHDRWPQPLARAAAGHPRGDVGVDRSTAHALGGPLRRRRRVPRGASGREMIERGISTDERRDAQYAGWRWCSRRAARGRGPLEIQAPIGAQCRKGPNGTVTAPLEARLWRVAGEIDFPTSVWLLA